MDVTELIVAMRGGVPDRCDYCGTEYSNEVHAIPDEAGTWSCTKCFPMDED